MDCMVRIEKGVVEVGYRGKLKKIKTCLASNLTEQRKFPYYVLN